jgi:LysR family transcriptional regulator, glycine cleavage system transcriptional activator
MLLTNHVSSRKSVEILQAYGSAFLPRSPNLKGLRMFDAAARHLNFRRAAEELNLTQGAVAQQVRALERDLGLTLFHRQARGLGLTELGRTYHDPIRRALALIDDATSKLRPDGARVTLSVPPSLATKWLVPRLAAFSLAHPEVDLETVASESIANFQSDGIDLAIRQGRPRDEAGLQSQLLAYLDLHAVCGPGLAKTLPPFNGIADFAAMNLIQDSHGFWERLLEQAGLSTRGRVVQFNQTALAMDAAANEQGIALAPRLLLDEDLARGRLTVLWRVPNTDDAGYYIVGPLSRALQPARDLVWDWIVSEIGRGPNFATDSA